MTSKSLFPANLKWSKMTFEVVDLCNYLRPYGRLRRPKTGPGRGVIFESFRTDAAKMELSKITGWRSAFQDL